MQSTDSKAANGANAVSVMSHLPITKEAIKYVPISTCSVLTDVMISGKFVEDGVEKSYDDFLNYCYSVMAAIDEYYFAKQK